MAEETATLSSQRIVADIRYALRGLARNRGFAVIAILTLALGISATTGIFSILYAYILRPLPLKEAEKLSSSGALSLRIRRNPPFSSIGAITSGLSSGAMPFSRWEPHSSELIP